MNIPSTQAFVYHIYSNLQIKYIIIFCVFRRFIEVVVNHGESSSLPAMYSKLSYICKKVIVKLEAIKSGKENTNTCLQK